MDVPAGISDGQRIRLTGRVRPASAAAAPATSTSTCVCCAHEHFERDGDDILYRQDLTMVQAALGATVTIPTLDGEEEVEFVAGTQPGEVKVLKGRGVPHLRGSGRGAQHILVNVLVPRNLNDQQREILRELDECCGMEHYSQKPEGFFGRLKNLFTS